MKRTTRTSATTFAFFLAAVSLGCSGDWVYRARLPEPNDTSNFAQSIALDGKVALVGSFGSADLFIEPRPNSPLPQHLWIKGQHFVPRRGSLGLFGQAVALSGDLLAIGAPYGDPAFVNNGYVDIFEHANNAFSFSQRLTPSGFEVPPSPYPEIMFGNALTFDADELFVGAHHYWDTAGVVFVFERNEGTFQQTQILKPAANVKESAFGEVIRVSGDTLAISRRGPGGAAGDPLFAGEVHLFVKVGGSWQLEQVLTSPTSHLEDFFGSGIDLDGDRLVVREDTHVHLFTRAGGVWSHAWQRAIPDGARKPVALRPSSNPASSYLFAAADGVVHVHTENAESPGFVFEGLLADPDGLVGFGTNLAISGNRLLASSPGGETPEVRVFRRPTLRRILPF